MNQELIEALRNLGLSSQQINSTAVNKVVDLLMSDNDKLLVREAEDRVAEMSRRAMESQRIVSSMQAKMEEMGSTLQAISDAQNEYGEIKESKAKDVVSLYGALLGMTKKYGGNDDVGLRCVSYIMWAYLHNDSPLTEIPGLCDITKDTTEDTKQGREQKQEVRYKRY